ncbi:MAG: succinate dehydrogenase assembly factor 2 [Betaproteobacteria bacterium]|jgi:antitoxin CptB
MSTAAAVPPAGVAGVPEALLDERGLSKLRWRCRRGLLENDLFVERFFQSTGAALTLRQAQALQVLMDLSDPDLLDLLLARREPEGELDLPDVRVVLTQMRAARAKPVN